MSMKIQIKIIGPLMYAAGFSDKELDVAAGTTAEALIESIGIPKDRPRIVTRNGNAAAPGEELADGDKVAVSPIYSGG
jgi:molybdopterin converting factor small subunit